MKKLLPFIWLLLATSCVEDAIEKYTGSAAINLFVEVKSKQANTAQVPLGFMDDSKQDTTIYLIANIQSTISTLDRTIKLRIPDSIASREGVYFSVQKEAILPAGATSVKIPLTVKRAGLKNFDKGLEIVVAVEPSADFKPGVNQSVSIIATDAMPTQWIGYTYWFPYYLGTCTKTKYRFVYQTLGFYDFTAIGFDYNALSVYKKYLNTKLDEYEVNNGVRLWDPDLNNNVIFP